MTNSYYNLWIFVCEGDLPQNRSRVLHACSFLVGRSTIYCAFEHSTIDVDRRCGMLFWGGHQRKVFYSGPIAIESFELHFPRDRRTGRCALTARSTARYVFCV